MPDEVRKGSISSTISPSSLASTNSIASTSSVPRALVRLLIGHTSQLLPKPTPDGRTHRWTMFVRPTGSTPFNDSSLINKVTFHLHESFKKPERTIKNPPFEVVETGYGGFTLPIDIYLNSASCAKPFKIFYELFLMLGSDNENIFEHKFEVKNPTESFLDLVRIYCPKPPKTGPSEILESQDGSSIAVSTPKISNSNYSTKRNSFKPKSGKKVAEKGDAMIRNSMSNSISENDSAKTISKKKEMVNSDNVEVKKIVEKEKTPDKPTKSKTVLLLEKNVPIFPENKAPKAKKLKPQPQICEKKNQQPVTTSTPKLTTISNSSVTSKEQGMKNKLPSKSNKKEKPKPTPDDEWIKSSLLSESQSFANKNGPKDDNNRTEIQIQDKTKSEGGCKSKGEIKSKQEKRKHEKPTSSLNSSEPPAKKTKVKKEASAVDLKKIENVKSVEITGQTSENTSVKEEKGSDDQFHQETSSDESKSVTQKEIDKKSNTPTAIDGGDANICQATAQQYNATAHQQNSVFPSELSAHNKPTIGPMTPSDLDNTSSCTSNDDARPSPPSQHDVKIPITNEQKILRLQDLLNSVYLNEERLYRCCEILIENEHQAIEMDTTSLRMGFNLEDLSEHTITLLEKVFDDIASTLDELF